MGQSYSVALAVTIKKDKQKDAAMALNAFMRKRHQQNHANFSLMTRASDEGLYPVGIIDSLAIVFSGVKQGFSLSSSEENGLQKIRIESTFDGSYGWMDVMEKAFNELVPFLEDNSEVEIWGDSDGSRSIVENGQLTYHLLEDDDENITKSVN